MESKEWNQLVNHKRKIGGRYETDILAEKVLSGEENPFEGLTVSKRKCYRTKSHKKGRSLPESNRIEEREAIDLFDRHDIFLDYQIPLRERKGEYPPDSEPEGRGKIDLLMELNGALYFIELKREDSQESLLRAILEIETYYRTADHELLRKCFERKGLPIKKAILLFDHQECRPYQECLSRDLPHVHKLLKEWEIEIFTIHNTSDRPKRIQVCE